MNTINNEMKEAIRENIIKYRKANGLKGKEIASVMNMNFDTYRSWESGRSTPKLESIVNLAKIYSVSVEDIITKHITKKNNPNQLAVATNEENEYDSSIYGDEYLSKLSSLEKTLIMKIRLLSPEEKKKFIEEITEFFD